MNTHNDELNNINYNFPSTNILFIPYSDYIEDDKNNNYHTPREIEINPTVTCLKRNSLIGLYGCNDMECNCDNTEKTGYCRLFQYKKWREIIDNKYKKNIVIII